MLGVDFDSDPQLPWVCSFLTPSSSPKVTALHSAALDYLGETGGENGEYLVRAMLRIRDVDPRVLRLPGGPERDGALCTWFEGLFPRKYRYQGEDATMGMIRRVSESAGNHGIASDAGIATCALSAFMLGVGYHRDPLYPWAARALDVHDTEDVKIGLLCQGGLHHLNSSLTGH
jgi:hypothetical protein